MAATFDYGQYTVNGKTVHLKWLEVPISEITVRDIGAQSTETSGFYGVNGVLFEPSGSAHQVYAYAINNGTAVRTSGNDNRGLGCMVYLKNQLGDGTFLFVKSGVTTFPFTHNGYSVSQSNVQWAVGGGSLRVADNITETEFYNSLEIDLSNRTDRPRTAIGYIGGNKVILCAIFDGDQLWSGGAGYGCNLWDVRTIMKNKFGCSMGINLDGGGSTMITYKLNGTNNTHKTENRSVYTMISAPM